MNKKQVPKWLWDFNPVYDSELLCCMVRGMDKRTGYEEVTGQTPDISEWLDFEFYDLVWWLDWPKKPGFTENTWQLAWWLGVSHQVGSDLSYWLITESGKIISKTELRIFTMPHAYCIWPHPTHTNAFGSCFFSQWKHQPINICTQKRA